jgi:3-hydroxybutyryl-CoA dehydrogenase
MTAIERVVVVGCGLMGSGIAEVCARAGIDVAVYVLDHPALEAGRGRIENPLAKAVARKKLTEGQRRPP